MTVTDNVRQYIHDPVLVSQISDILASPCHSPPKAHSWLSLHVFSYYLPIPISVSFILFHRR